MEELCSMREVFRPETYTSWQSPRTMTPFGATGHEVKSCFVHFSGRSRIPLVLAASHHVGQGDGFSEEHHEAVDRGPGGERPETAGRLLMIAAALAVVFCALTDSYAQDPKSVRPGTSAMELADHAYRDGRFQDALTLYSQVPDRSSSFFCCGMAHEMLNRPEKAAEEYRKAIEADPGNYRALENLAGIYERDGGKISEAVTLYRQALALDPRPEWKEQCAAAIAMLESRLRPEDASAIGCWHLGNKKALAGDDRSAEILYTRAIDLDPDLFQAYFTRGLLKVKLGNLQDALTDFDETVRLAPRLRGAGIQQGLIHEKMGRLVEAGKSFERAAANDPRDPEVWYHLGRVREEAKDYQSAMECYQEALGLKPKPELGKLIRERVSAVWTLGNFHAKKNSATLKKLRELW